MSQPDRFIAPPTSPATSATVATTPRPRRNPLHLVLDLFSSVWLGVILLSLLFIYSSIGSSGVPIHIDILDPAHWISVRQLPWFEMTEMEWFHWWPFNLLIALICMNLVVATLRRIPFNVINLGVWMIHAGIITLAAGSVWYFSTKVEGDAPVNRRRIVAIAPGMNEPASMVALPGNSMMVGKSNQGYELQVVDIDPQWELLSGDDKGTRAYKVSVRVRSRTGEFVRELIANRPQYTQDLVRNTDPSGGQPFQRAVNVLGKPLVDEALQLTLDYDPQQHFYLMDSRAVYLREVGQKQWVQRPIPAGQLPRYNDYIASFNDVWTSVDEPVHPSPINVAVPPASADDPLPNETFNVTRFLRYAQLESKRRAAPEARLDPTASVRLLSPTGQSQEYQLVAFDPANNSALRGTLMMAWIDSNAALEQLKSRVDPVIRFTVPGSGVTVEEPILKTLASDPDLQFKQIEGTEYSYRVESLQSLSDLNVSVAIVELKTPQRTFKRWIFDDPTKNRDMAMAEGLAQHGADIPLDTKIESVFLPGALPPAPIMVLAGPGQNDLAVMITKAVGQPEYHPVRPGETVAIAEGVTMVIDRYAARTLTETKPRVVPRMQRDRDMREFMSMIQLDVPTTDGVASLWLPYHHFAFATQEEVLRRFPYNPQVVTLPDGRQIEVMFSRERMELPAPVVLEDFKVATHIGGFTGQTSSIMDWTSVIRFRDMSMRHIAYTEPETVSVNKPTEQNGYWFFQAQWDPPDRSRFQGDPGSRGLNYTVLGVGNRNGVYVQLAGCCIAVFGMIYAFYGKPAVKRRRQQRVYAEVAMQKEAHALADELPVQPVGAAWKVES